METTSSPTASTADAAAAGQATAGRLGRLWQSSAFPAVLQAAALAVLVAMIAAGWGRTGLPGGVAVPLLYTNLATLGFWTIWLMALILLLPGIGRLWCTVCPVGWCNDLAARAGAKTEYPRRWQHLGVMALLLFGFNAAAELWGLNRSPDATAKLLALAVAAAVLAGLVFRGRVFCRFWCPVGGMVALTSRLAPVEIAARDHAVCRRCESKACYFGSTRWFRLSWSAWHTLFPVKRPGCPAYLFPPETAPGPHCLMCTECVKNCPYGNIGWRWRPVAAGLWPSAARDRGEALLVVVMTGLVFHRLARFWSGLRTVVEWPTELVAAAVPALPPLGLKGVNLLCGFVLWPLAFYLVLAFLARAASSISIVPWPAPGEEPQGLLYDVAEIDREQRGRERGWAARRRSLWGFIAVYGYAAVPVIAGAYAAFALVKLNEKTGYLPLAIADPAGIRTSVAINQLHILAGPESLLPLPAIRWAALALAVAGLAAGLWSAGRVGARAYGEGSPEARRGSFVFRAGIAGLGAVLLLSLRAWLFRGALFALLLGTVAAPAAALAQQGGAPAPGAATASMFGKVTRETEPAAGARVLAYASFADLLAARAAAVSEPAAADGGYRISLPPGTYYLAARGEGTPIDGPVPAGGRFSFHGSNPFTLVPGSATEANFSLARKIGEPVVEPGADQGSGALAGTVTLEGRGVEGVQVKLYLDAESAFRGMGYAAAPPTDGSGAFALEFLPESDYYVVARRRAAGAGPGPLGEGDLFGYFVDNPVRVRNGQVVRIVLELVTKGRDTGNADARPRPSGTRISGRITDAAGAVVPGVYAFAYEEKVMAHKKPAFISRPVDAEGRYVINLGRGGTFYVGARSAYGDSPGRGEWYGRYDGAPDHAVTVAEGAGVDGVDIRVERILE